MEIKKFRHHYGLELIAAPHAGISLGDLVWDSLLGAPSFSHPGMPESIGIAFLDAGLLEENEFKTFQKELSDIETITAHFPDRTVDVKSEVLGELKHPTLGNLEGNFKLDHISKFAFGELQVKVMNDLLRVKIDQYLELMKEKKWAEYDGKIRKVFMITELYMGSIKLVVEKSLSGKFDAALEQGGLTLSSRSEGSKSVEYEFAHEEVPFAMRIEELKSFNG